MPSCSERARLPIQHDVIIKILLLIKLRATTASACCIIHFRPRWRSRRRSGARPRANKRVGGFKASQPTWCGSWPWVSDQGRSRAHEPQQRGITKRDDRASAIAILYQTCKTWRKQLSDDGFCMRTFSLCRALADGNSPQTLQRVQATIGRQLEQTSDKDVTDQAWWLDARSLVQRCNFALDRGTFGAGYRQPRRSRTAPCRGKQLLRQRCWGRISCAGQTSLRSGFLGCAR